MPAPVSLDRLIRPRSVVIVGASDKPGSLGASVIENLDRLAFEGDVHLVNPKREMIGGRRCLASVADLPFGVDAAILAIPRAGVLGAVRALADRGVGAAVIFSAGFAEGGAEGLAEQREIARVAADADMAIEGPNCLGLINFVDSVPLTFIETDPTAPVTDPAIGIVSQSGAIAAVVGTVLLNRGLPISYSVSTGNEASTGVEDFLEWLVDDDMTSMVGMVVEQFRQPARFLAAAERARAAGKPIILLHPGRSTAARESAATHTGALAGDHDLMSAKVAAAGVIQVATLEEFGDCIEIIRRCGPASTAGTLVIGESGAFKALTLDFAEAVGLDLPVAADADSPALRAALPEFVPVSNPIDMTAQGLVDPGLYGRLIAGGSADERFGAILLGIIQTDAGTCAIKFPAILAGLRETKPAKAVIVAGLDDGARVPDDYIAALRDLGVPYFPSAERVMRALAALARAGGNVSPSKHVAETARIAVPSGMLAEHASKALLAPLGIAFPVGGLATSQQEAISVADRVGYPVVLKAQSAALPHKSDAGGVVVGLGDPEAVRAAWTSMHDTIAERRPGLMLDGVLVERMSPKGVELIVGARNDPDWGAVVLVGFGGVQAEVIKDVRLIVPGMDEDAVVRELLSLKGAALLTGFRGSEPVDLQAVAKVACALGRLVAANPRILEIDLNPVMAYPDGAVALDALIVSE